MAPRELKEKKKKKKKKKLDFGDTVIHSEVVPEDATFVEYLVIPPDGGWGWVVALVAFLSNAIVDGIIFSCGTFLVEIANDLETPISKFNWANSTMCALYFLAGPIVCALSNRMGFRIVAILGGISGAGALMAASFAPNFPLFFASYGVWLGCSFSMTYLSNILAVGFYFDKWRPLALAICVTGSGVGTVIIPAIMNTVLLEYDWRFKFKCLSGSMVLVAALYLTYKPISPIMITANETNVKKLEEIQSIMSMSVNEDNPKSIFYKKHNTEYPTQAAVASNSAYDFYAPARRDNSGTLRSMSRMGGLQIKKTYDPIKTSLSRRSLANQQVSCCNKYHTHTTQRPMYQDDILYTGSIYNFQPTDKNDKLEYHMSVTRIATVKDREDEFKCVCCPEAVKRTLATMFAFQLMRIPSFFLLLLSGFITYLGLYIPYVYLPQLGEAENMPTAAFLVSAIGIANTIGRFSTGLLVMAPNVKALLLTEIALALSGISVCICGFFTDQLASYICAAVFGFTISCIASLRPIIAVEMVGLENLTNAFGLVVLFEGIASLIGLPLAGIIKDCTNGFLITFLYGGSMIVLSSVVLLPIPALIKIEKLKAAHKDVSDKLSDRDRLQKYTQQKLEAINKPQTSKKPMKV